MSEATKQFEYWLNDPYFDDTTKQELLAIRNNESEVEDRFYKELTKEPWASLVKVVDFGSQDKFNYSDVMNFGIKHSVGDYIVLLNNDIQIITVNWMEEMLMYAQRSDVGAVGAKLYFPDRKIQHAGVILGLGAHRTAGHSHYGMEGTNQVEG